MKVSQIRAIYPDPIKSTDVQVRPACYCVGGAFIRFYRQDPHFYGFPEVTDITAYLQFITGMDWDTAYSYAELIVLRNDEDGDFDGAWSALDAALNHEDDRR